MEYSQPPVGYQVKREQTQLGPGYSVKGPGDFKLTVIGGKGRRAIHLYRQAVEKCWEDFKAKQTVTA